MTNKGNDASTSILQTNEMLFSMKVEMQGYKPSQTCCLETLIDNLELFKVKVIIT